MHSSPLAFSITSLVPDYFCSGLHQADSHYYESECCTYNGHIRRPTSLCQLYVTERRQDIGESTGRSCANQLKHSTKIAGNQSHSHRGHYQRCSEDDMNVSVERLFWQKIIDHDLTTHEAFERKGA